MEPTPDVDYSDDYEPVNPGSYLADEPTTLAQDDVADSTDASDSEAGND